MAFAPSSAPVKSSASRAAASVSVEEEIQNVAERFTQNLLTYKASTVDADLDRARRDGTSELATRPLTAFRGITMNEIASQVKENNATSSVNVQATAVQSRDDETATVLVVTQRTIDSDERDEPNTGLLVVELTMQRTDDGWKVDDVVTPAAAQ